jgi:methionyl-tRNA formyltransferase
MKVFLCGQGPAAESVLRTHLTPANGVEQVVVFTHRDAGWIDQLRAWRIHYTFEPVNWLDLWPFEPDMIISIYYRTIITPAVIDRVGGRIFNAHVSLLPRHRGRSPVPWAIVEGDKHTGVTYHYIDAGIDTGPVILQAVCQVAENETQTSLFNKLNGLVIAYFPAALALALAGFGGVDQQGEANYHHEGCPYAGEIDPAWPVAKIERFIRAMHYPPLKPARFNGQNIYTWEDYKLALNEKHRATQSNNRLPV